jgi:hypothetical protein
VPEQGRTVAQAAFAGQVVRGLHKSLHLWRNGPMTWHSVICITEVGHEGNFLHLRQGIEPVPRGPEMGRAKSKAIHARVHFQEHAMWHLCLVRGKHVDLLIAMHHVPQPQPGTQLQVALLKYPLQQQHWSAPTQVTHPLGFGQVEQRKPVGGTQGIKHPLNAVTIGIGLDHCPHSGIARRLTGQGEVVAQGVLMDCGMYGARHG